MSPGDECSLSSDAGQDSETSTDLLHKLVSAIQNHELETVCTMLDQGADANARDQKSSLLHYAVRAGQSDIVEVLLGHGADPNGLDGKDHRPLFTAVSDGHDKIVELLLDGGATLYHLGHFDHARLMSWAVRHGPQMTATLLANGVEPNDPDCIISPLTEAVRTGCPEVIKLLLANGAKPNARNCTGLAVLHSELIGYIRCSNFVEVFNILLANHFDPFAQRYYRPHEIDYINEPDLSFIRQAERFRHIELVNILKNYTPVPYQPASLQCWARASIRSRLVQNRANLAQTLSADSHCLPLPKDLKIFVYRPLSF